MAVGAYPQVASLISQCPEVMMLRQSRVLNAQIFSTYKLSRMKLRLSFSKVSQLTHCQIITKGSCASGLTGFSVTRVKKVVDNGCWCKK